MNTMRVATTQATVPVQPRVPVPLAGRTFFEGPSFQGRPGGLLPRERPHAVHLSGQLEGYSQRLPVGKPQETSQQSAQLPAVEITENAPTTNENENLIGTPPSTFDGDRSKGDQFITQFGLFRNPRT